MDMFNLNIINKDIIMAVQVLTSIPSSCEDYLINTTDDNGEKIVGKVTEIDELFNKLKKDIVKMINSIDNENDGSQIDIEPSENGLKIIDN